MPPLFRPGQDFASEVASNPTFASIAQEVQHEREAQAIRQIYEYPISGEVRGQQTLPFIIQIEQGSDFSSRWITGSCDSYDAVNASSFPVPNSLGLTAWAGRGLMFMFTDTGSGTQLTSDFVAAENFLTPGYGIMFSSPKPFRNLFLRNSKVRVDVRNLDNNLRVHRFSLSLSGYKITTP